MHEYHNQTYNKFVATISWPISTEVRSFELLPCHSHKRKFLCILIQYWLKKEDKKKKKPKQNKNKQKKQKTKKMLASIQGKSEDTCGNSKWGLLRRTNSLKLDNLIQMCSANVEDLQNSEKSNF